MTEPYIRPIDAQYQDPLDLIWLHCARTCGFEVERAGDVYASYDAPRHVLRIATADAFDPDDNLGQMIFHELCHALVAGPDGAGRADFGLENVDDRDLVQEHATHRLQAHLADRHGLRGFFAVTTMWRPYWNRLPRDPLAAGDDPAIALALAARERARSEPWASALDKALHATAILAGLVRDLSPEGSLWRRASPRVTSKHALGVRLGPPGETCGSCAWSHRDGDARGHVVVRCAAHRQAENLPPRIDPTWSSCASWEPKLDASSCAACGACCREAFHLVPVDADEPLLKTRPDLVTRDAQGHSPFFIARPFGTCLALAQPAAPYRCAVYEDRPRSCRDFAVGSANCLEARRRVGLSSLR